MRNFFLCLFGISMIIGIGYIMNGATGTKHNVLVAFQLISWVGYVLYLSFGKPRR